MNFHVKHNIKSLLILFSCSFYMFPVSANEQALRYRGQYTFGHEVNTFCPQINSQCYWLSPSTSSQIRQQLKQISKQNTDKPYQSVCVVLQGKIDRETKGDGFATDYDGFCEVYKVFGLCNKTDIVTQGDLQHHRWVLKSINGVNIDLAQWNNNIPNLDFGEQMTLSTNTGCDIHTGRAILRENYIIFTLDISKSSTCTAKQQKMELLLKEVLNSEPKITIDSDKNLLLENANTVLKYQLKDWVY